jgi:hypothetical protein
MSEVFNHYQREGFIRRLKEIVPPAFREMVLNEKGEVRMVAKPGKEVGAMIWGSVLSNARVVPLSEKRWRDGHLEMLWCLPEPYYEGREDGSELWRSSERDR